MQPIFEIKPEEIFTDNHSLPPLPEVVIKIQEMIRINKVDINKISKMVSSDVSLAAHVLKIVNSAYYSLTKEVSNLKFAIAYLGINEVYRIVLSVSVISAFKIENRNLLKDFWYHSFYSALCAKALAKKYAPYEDVEDIWSSALLHDIGKLVFMQFYPDAYEAAAEHTVKHQCFFSEAEIILGLPKSSELGGMLCDYWKLPMKIKTACQVHTLADLEVLDTYDPDFEFKRTICLGNLFSQLSRDNLTDEKKQDIYSTMIAKSNMTEEDLKTNLIQINGLQLIVEEFIRQLF